VVLIPKDSFLFCSVDFSCKPKALLVLLVMENTTAVKKAKQSEYETVCRELGIDPSVHFVEITKTGSISFTAGKPDECRKLAYKARQAGYNVSRDLAKACR
jgi:hypothetical protein